MWFSYGRKEKKIKIGRKKSLKISVYLCGEFLGVIVEVSLPFLQEIIAFIYLKYYRKNIKENIESKWELVSMVNQEGKMEPTNSFSDQN